MRLTIAPKLFLALLLTNMLLIGTMTGVLRWRTEHDFHDYLRGREVERVAPLVAALARYYQAHQNWDGLRHNHALWRQTVATALPTLRFRADHPPPRRPPPDDWGDPQQGFRRPPPFGTNDDPPFDQPRRPPPRPRRPPPPISTNDPLQLVSRLVLIDDNEAVIMGPHPPVADALRLPIQVDQQPVGWLTIAPSPFPTDQLTRRFLDQQRDIALIIIAVALLISVLVALLLTRGIVGPIKKVADGARALASGVFSSRVPQNGNDELAGLARDFNSLAKTLEQNEQARRTWIADISHELRTPLSILRGEIEAIEDGVRQVTPESIHSLHCEVLGLSQLVDDLYQLSLSDLGALTYRKTTVNLGAVLNDLIDRFAPRLSERKIELVGKVVADPQWKLSADRERLVQLFTNLLENSCRYTDPGGRIELRMRLRSGWLIVDLEDSAPGIPEAAYDRLFERLYRVDASRNRRQGGAGLGLSICKSIVEGHDGTITAAASRLGGIRITVGLPV